MPDLSGYFDPVLNKIRRIEEILREIEMLMGIRRQGKYSTPNGENLGRAIKRQFRALGDLGIYCPYQEWGGTPPFDEALEKFAELKREHRVGSSHSFECIWDQIQFLYHAFWGQHGKDPDDVALELLNWIALQHNLTEEEREHRISVITFLKNLPKRGSRHRREPRERERPNVIGHRPPLSRR